MPKKGKISELFEIDELQKQQKIAMALVDQFITKVNETKPIRVSLEGAEKTKDILKGIAELSAKQKETVRITSQAAKATNDLDKAKQKLAASEKKEAKELAFINAQRAENAKNLKLQAQLENAVAGSLEETRLKIKDVYRQRELLNLSTEAGRKKQQELNKELDRLNAIIDENTHAFEKQKRNIGNYQGSAKIIVDAFERAQQKVKAFNDRFGETSPEARAARQELEGLQRITESPQFLKISAKYGDSIQETRAFTKVLVQLENQGQGNSEAANELRARLAELTDQIGDTRAEIKALASDTRTFDLFASSISALVSIYQTAVGVAEAFGASEEDTAEITKNLIAVENIANGVRAIANELTTRGTAANKLYAFSQLQIKTALDTTAASATRLKAALFAVGIGALVIGITLLIAKWTAVKNALSGVTVKQREANAAIVESHDAYVDAVKLVEDLRIKINLAKDGFINKEKVVKMYNETIGETTGQVKTLDEAEKALVKNADAYIQFTLKKAAANILLQKAAEKAVDAAIENQQEVEKISRIRRNDPNDPDNVGEFLARGIDNERKAREKANQKRIQTLKDLAEEFNRQAAQIAKDFNFNFFGTNSDDLAKAQDDIKNLIELQKIRQATIKDSNDRIASDEEKSTEIRVAAMQRAADAEIEIVRLSKNQQLLDSQLSAKAKEVIEAQAAADIEKIQKDSEEKIAEFKKEMANRDRQAQLNILKLQLEDAAKAQELIAENEKKSFNERTAALYAAFEKRRAIIIADYYEQVRLAKDNVALRKEIEQKYVSDINQLTAQYGADQLSLYKDNEQAVTEAIEKERQKRLDNISRDQAKEIIYLNEQLRNRAIAFDDYNRKRSEIERGYSLVSLQQEINVATARVLATKEGTAERAAAEKELAEKTKQYQDEVLANEERLRDLRKEIGQESFSFLTTLFNAQYTQELNAIQQQIDALERKKQKDIEVANAQVGTEEEKAARITIIENRAQAEREALEMRQRQLEIERARFEKAATIAKIIGDTAAAVVAALGSKPFTPANIAQAKLVGALGALQLANAIAAPIPQYEKGTDDAEGGISLVGEKRKEWVLTPDGQLYATPSRPTFMDIPQHSVVFPDTASMLKALELSDMSRLARIANMRESRGDSGRIVTKGIEKRLDTLTTAVINKQEVHFEAGFNSVMALHKYGNIWNRYVDEQTNW